ncbi:signal transduction histidine kinase [Neolewinella xylanilytica]|uniref:histidine kinase n=1 Tax=Neolewinella xylanilytica TaxID=1514080 RepID=A0A2S6IAA9_9BACT|nr:signal transduction histidine kinase [Neolewinella xylanilytica]
MANLREFDILDTLPEDEYDDLVTLAAEICQTPVAQIALVDEDRLWYKAEYGFQIPGRQIPRNDGFCTHTILEKNRPLIVSDMRVDERFRHNPFVAQDPNVVFYAGFPLCSREGYPLGSLCVIDLEPRQLSEGQLNSLRRLSNQAVKLLELHRSVRVSQDRLREKEYAYRLLRDFSHIIAHDLKAPVRNIRQVAEILREDHQRELSAEAAHLFAIIESRAADAGRMIEGVLRYSKVSGSMDAKSEPVVLADLIPLIAAQVGKEACRIEYVGKVEALNISPIALKHIFQNLIGNAVKFNDKPEGRVVIDSWYTEGVGCTFTVSDNGPGIPEREIGAIFQLFHSAGEEHLRGHGVGLSIVRRLLEDLSGSVSVASKLGEGATFTLVIPSRPISAPTQLLRP